MAPIANLSPHEALTPNHVLIADTDGKSAAEVKAKLLKAFPQTQITIVDSRTAMCRALIEHQIDFIITELDFEDSKGLATLEGMQELTQMIPLLVCAAKDDSELAIQSVQHGAQDYLVKGRGTPYTYKRIIQHSLERKRLIMEAQRISKELEEAKNTLENKVTERTRDLEGAMIMAQEASKAKEDFFANMTHELRTPLHAIINFSKFGLKRLDTAPKEKIESYFTDIHRSGERLLGLVNDMLDLTKHQSGKDEFAIREDSLVDTVHAVATEMSAILESKEMIVQIAIDEGCGKARFDRRRIHQVLVNLMSNAAKFSPDGSKIALLVEDAANFKQLQHSGVNTYGDMIVISVVDSGVGIPEEELSMIFDEFAQSSKVKSGTFSAGTGLGLSICRQIVQAHGGSIWAESNPEGGAILRFVLPKA